MKKYYSILLPYQTDNEVYTYSSESEIIPGARVIINFNRKVVTGICRGENTTTEIDKSYRIKPVMEILDAESIIPPSLIDLSTWISRYYRCSAGKAIFAMLPSVVLPEIATHITWTAPPEQSISNIFNLLHLALSDSLPHSIKEIRQELGSTAFYKTLEQAEEEGLITIKRGFDKKVKPKTQNYIQVLSPEVTIELTLKQSNAWEIILQKGKEFPMAEITDDVTYSIIKALVQKGLIRIEPRQIEYRAATMPELSAKKEVTLTSEQIKIINTVLRDSQEPKVSLVFGITGSGKTEVYIEIIKHYLQLGKNAIMLIPEIALTPQMVDRFYNAFEENIAILHSQLTERQRYEQWQEIKHNKCRIVIGARSAVFAPLTNIGVIVVDEEHEQSYKQDNSPRYNGRDVAIVRGKIEKAAVILGSATPSLESWNNALLRKFELHTLNSRPTLQGLPEVHLLDLREEEGTDLISQTLRECITESLERKEQVILMQNRRGFASFMQCLKCGILQKCPHCEVSLYYHHDKEELLCHYCGYHLPVPRKCPDCGSYSYSYGAPGTQKIEQLLHTYFPAARVLRLDSDSSRRKDTYNYMYEKMRKRDIDILLGTQMISKGLDFPNVTLVGVILADVSLNVPDFRASERTFNLLTQVAGRSGRGDLPGKVIIQSWNPEHYAITHAVNQDYLGFAQEELSYRRRLFYPPYARLGRLVIASEDIGKLKLNLDKYHNTIDKIRQKHSSDELVILGPVPAPMSKLKNLFRYHIIVKARDAALLSTVILNLERLLQFPSVITLTIDIDPMTLM